MKSPTLPSLIFILLVTFSCSPAAFAGHHDDFLECLSKKFSNGSISNLVYTPSNPSYSSILLFPIWNLRFTSDSTPKPQVIITPEHESQIPPIIHCAKQNGIEIRTRSGGHDFEALSSISKVSFVIIDLFKLSEIRVDAVAKTAWVEAGATLGSLYYRIAEKSTTLGFPGGACATVGVGGHIGGGGYGTLMRRYGLAADHVIDARIVDAKGRILDRKSMGEDLFWAIRGGGAASFGVVLAWKLQLVDVPERVTVFSVQRTTEQNLTRLIHRWQYVAPRMDRDITLFINAVVANSSQPGRDITIDASFFAVFLGGVDRLLAMMQQSFPELGLVREDCTEMSWIQSVLFMDGHPIETPEALLSRAQPNKSFMKRKTDFVQKPIHERGLEGLIRLFYEPEARLSTLTLVPDRGRMAEIPESALPYPHRAGNLYHVYPTVYWQQDEAQNSQRYVNWLNRAYSYMTPYVTKNPRAAYINYRDLDIGVNNDEVVMTSVSQASIWGVRYFKNNFDRLVWVKTKVDPKNFFRHQQSIPPLQKF